MAFAREIVKFSRLCNLNDFAKLSNFGSLKSTPFILSVRTSKHWNPKFKWLRGKKVIETILPFTEKDKEYKKYINKILGIYPRYWKRRPLTITSAGEIFDPYQPPSGDGKITKLSNLGVLEKVTTSSKDLFAEKNALRKIRNFDASFQVPIFLQEAHDIYVKVHSLLQKMDPEDLCKYATEKAISEMMEGLKHKTIHWKIIESLEPPKLVQSRVQEVLVKKNLFAQLTVRFHTKQILAIYDRFGRLMYGSEILAKDVFEYVVFEKHINNEYGVWKLHGKIIPEWKESTVPYPRTYRIEKEVEEEENENEFESILGDFTESELKNKTTAEIVEADSTPSK